MKLQTLFGHTRNTLFNTKILQNGTIFPISKKGEASTYFPHVNNTSSSYIKSLTQTCKEGNHQEHNASSTHCSFSRKIMIERNLEDKKAFSTSVVKGKAIDSSFNFSQLTLNQAKSAAHQIAADYTKCTLAVKNTNFDDVTMRYLGWALETNTHLNYIFLTENNINDDLATILASCLKNAISITSVDLSNNDIGDKGLATLTKLVQNHPHIKEIILDGNPCAEKNLRLINPAFIKNKENTDNLIKDEAVICSKSAYTWREKEETRTSDTLHKIRRI